MIVEWSLIAEIDMRRIANDLERKNPRAGSLMLRRIYDNFERLSAFPSLGRTGRIDGTRELAIADTPYVIIYVLSDRCILSSASSTERNTGPTPEHGKMKID